MRALLSYDIAFTNKELLQLLQTYRKAIWDKENNITEKRRYYGILANQAQLAGRDGEMLYYADRFNELEQQTNGHPSLTALSIQTGYYNTAGAYAHSNELYNSNQSFLTIRLPSLARNGDLNPEELVQASIVLNHFAEAAYHLDDTTRGIPFSV